MHPRSHECIRKKICNDRTNLIGTLPVLLQSATEIGAGRDTDGIGESGSGWQGSGRLLGQSSLRASEDYTSGIGFLVNRTADRNRLRMCRIMAAQGWIPQSMVTSCSGLA
jgi:hypothetical protein